MTITIVQLGSPRAAGEGLRIGTVRRTPRGVAKAEWAKRDLFDVWFPNLAPSEELLREYRDQLNDADGWRRFSRRFLAEMKQPTAQRDLDLLAALSHHTALAIGCYCEEASRCHRSLLRELLAKRGAALA